MDYKSLLDKYWVGETTIEEEKILKAYFESEPVDPALEPYIHLFNYQVKAKKQYLNKPIATLIQGNNDSVKVVRLKANIKIFCRIAAAISLIIVSSLGYYQFTKPSKAERLANFWAAKEIKDPKEALRKTKAALLLVSTKLNNGTEAALQQVAKVQQVGQFIKSPD